MLPSNLAASSQPINGSKSRLDSLTALTVAVAGKTSVAISPSPAVAACSGLVVTDSRCSLVRDAKTGAGCPYCEPLGRVPNIDGNESTARRGACCFGDAVFSRTPNWVG